jgi:hypothetical protein
VKTPLRKRALPDRESRRWVEGAEQTRPVLAGTAMVTMVSDREGDIYPSWARLPGVGFHVLNWVISGRRPRFARASLAGDSAKGATLHGGADSPLAGTRTIELPARLPDRAACEAKVEIRFGEVENARSANETDRTLSKTVRLCLVEMRELEPPEGVEPLHWRLLTTHEVDDLANAWQIVGWYQARWSIEQLFRVMKSQGFGLEESQLNAADRLVRLAAVATKANCIEMQLGQERDGKHGLAAATVFTEPEIDTIEALNPTLERKTERQQNPHPAGGLGRADGSSPSPAFAGSKLLRGQASGAGTVVERLQDRSCFVVGMERINAIHQGRTLK